jgi:hypothetical protein
MKSQPDKKRIAENWKNEPSNVIALRCSETIEILRDEIEIPILNWTPRPKHLSSTEIWFNEA